MASDETPDKTGRRPAPKPARSPAGKARAADKQARLAEALRANLRKRKAQRRGRGDDGA